MKTALVLLLLSFNSFSQDKPASNATTDKAIIANLNPVDDALKVAGAEIASLRAQLAEAQQSLAICQLPGVIETHAASIAAQRHACEVTGGQFQQGQQGMTCTPKPKPAKPGETK